MTNNKHGVSARLSPDIPVLIVVCLKDVLGIPFSEQTRVWSSSWNKVAYQSKMFQAGLALTQKNHNANPQNKIEKMLERWLKDMGSCDIFTPGRSFVHAGAFVHGDHPCIAIEMGEFAGYNPSSSSDAFPLGPRWEGLSLKLTKSCAAIERTQNYAQNLSDIQCLAEMSSRHISDEHEPFSCADNADFFNVLAIYQAHTSKEDLGRNITPQSSLPARRHKL